MSNSDLISVIIPVYNVEPWLEQCLDSFISQTYKNLEIICVDDCSTDNCYEILKRYEKLDPRITVIQNKKNIGLGLTRNAGLKLAKGKWIHFFDSDDWLDTDAYEKLTGVLNSLDFVPDLLFFNYRKYYDKKKRFVEVEFPNKSILYKNLSPLRDVEAFDNWDRYAWMKLHRREFLEENKILFNDYRCMEDMEFATQLYLKAKSICYTDICCVNYRKRKGSLIKQTLQHMDCKLNSFLYSRPLYEQLTNDNIKYRLIGFDYWQIRNDLEKAWIGKHISLLKVLYILFRVNKKDTKNYIYKNENMYDAGYILKFYPMFVNKYFNGDEHWYRNIFSIQNIKGKNKNKHKCITIAGIKFKIKLNK